MKKNFLIIAGLLLFAVAFGQHEKWTILEKEIPIDETLKAGTKVVFPINFEGHTQIDYSNKAETKTKFIYHVFENGEPLPEGTIAPVRYRTKELAPGAGFQMTYSWKKGQEICIEAHTGVLHILVYPEKKPL